MEFVTPSRRSLNEMNTIIKNFLYVTVIHEKQINEVVCIGPFFKSKIKRKMFFKNESNDKTQQFVISKSIHRFEKVFAT